MRNVERQGDSPVPTRAHVLEALKCTNYACSSLAGEIF